MKNNPVGWFEIYVQDLGRAKRFYERVFKTDLTPLETPVPGIEMLTFPMERDVCGAPGALVRMADGPGGGNAVLVYFNCEDCAAEESRVAEEGGKVEKPKMSIGEYGFISLVRDSEGNMIGLHSME